MKLDQYTHLINDAIANIDYPHEPSGLYAPIKYVLGLGGKRIRPILSLMACNMFGSDPKEALPAALGIEIFHNFTLLHDDVMDKADMRRGKPTVHRVWDENTAILSGDVMQILAYKQFFALPDSCLKPALELFSTMASEICEGQQYDMEFESRSRVSADEYIEMIRLKTAVLLGTSLRIGALVANASTEDAERIYRFGVFIGLAFQLKDDLLDVYGDPERFGKNIGGDILNNKKTYLLISALKQAEGALKDDLDGWLARKAFDPAEKISAITRIYNSLQIKELCEQKMEEYYRLAQQELNEIALPAERKTELQELAHRMMDRDV